MIEVDYEWMVICSDDDFVEASGTAFDIETAERECFHYFNQYAQDEKCRYEITRVTREVLKRG
jgi:hypothetical protein